MLASCVNQPLAINTTHPFHPPFQLRLLRSFQSGKARQPTPPPPPSAKFYRESPENKFTVICSLFITYLLLALESSETESLKQHKIGVRNLLISRAPFSKREFEGIQSSVVWAGPEGVRLRKS